MAYILLYTQSAYRDIQKLDAVTKRKLKKKIETHAVNPLNYAKKLTNRALGTYRWRAGNYRIVFDIDRDKIIILRVGHRKEIYREH